MLATFQFSIICLNICYVNLYRLKYTELQFCPQLYIGTELGFSCEQRYEVLISLYRVAILTVFCGFCHFIHAHAKTVPLIRPHPLTHTSLDFSHSTQYASDSVKTTSKYLINKQTNK
jgi:hypothetical protein